MKLFHRSPVPAPAQQPWLPVIRSLYEEEGIPFGSDAESRWASVPMSRLFECGSGCPRLIWLGSGAPGPCAVCGRALREVAVEWRDLELPKELRDDFAADAHFQYAVACWEQQRLAEAERSLTRAIELRPGYEDAYHNRAQVRNALNKTGEAIADCDAVMRINPKGADTLVTRAGLKAHKQDWAGAIVDAAAAIEMGTKKPFAYFIRGMGRLNTGQAGAAMADLRRYLELEPTGARSDVVRRILKL